MKPYLAATPARLAPALFLTLVSCTFLESPEIQPPTYSELASEIAALLNPEEMAAFGSAPKMAIPNPIRIPRDAPWLGETLAATYQATPAEAVQLVLQGRPVTWDLQRPAYSSDLLVTSPYSGAGTIVEHLDHIASLADWSWSVKNGRVNIEDMPTRNYPIAAMPGSLEASLPFRAMSINQAGAGVAAGVGGSSQAGQGGGGGQAGGLSEQNAENNFSINTDVYGELRTALNQILGLPISTSIPQTAGEIMQAVAGDALAPSRQSATQQAQAPPQDYDRPGYTIVPSANLLILTAPPSIHDRVNQVLDELNSAINRKVLLTITIYEVQFTDARQRGLDLQLFRTAATAAGINLNGSALDITSPNGLSLDLASLEGNAFDGSTLIYSLLELQGHTTVRLHEEFEAISNVPLSISDERAHPYISEVSLGNTIGGALSQVNPQIQTSQLSTGFAFHALASIAGEDNISVRITLSQADLVRWEQYQFGSGVGAISGTLPITDSQHRVIRMNLQNNETRLVANLTKTAVSGDQANQNLGLLGSSAEQSSSEQQTLISVTATIL